MEKHCSKCNRTLPANSEFFTASRSRKDGLYSYCKDCHGKRGREYYAKNCNRIKGQYKAKAPESKLGHRHPHADKVIAQLKETPHLCNKIIAERSGSSYPYVCLMRKVMESRGEIEFQTKLLNEKGKWRKRLIRAETIDPWGSFPVVYFIQCGDDGPVKIGRTNRMILRLQNLQASCPYPLRLVLTLEDTGGLEGQLHDKFVEDHLHHEWFSNSKQIQEFIKQNERYEPVESRPIQNL